MKGSEELQFQQQQKKKKNVYIFSSSKKQKGVMKEKVPL